MAVPYVPPEWTSALESWSEPVRRTVPRPKTVTPSTYVAVTRDGYRRVTEGSMGARNAILMYVDAGTDVRAVLQAAPPPDREATRSLVERLYPSRRVVPIGDGDLEQNSHPPTNQVYAACFPGLSVVCTEDASLGCPSRLAEPFLAEAKGRTLYLHARFGSVDWFGYAIREPDGTLRRSLSLCVVLLGFAVRGPGLLTRWRRRRPAPPPPSPLSRTGAPDGTPGT